MVWFNAVEDLVWDRRNEIARAFLVGFIVILSSARFVVGDFVGVVILDGSTCFFS
jgi:hypothetical protein